MALTTQGAICKAFLVEPLASEGATPTFDASSEIYAYQSETMSKTASILDPNTIRGTRSHFGDSARDGNNTVGGSVTLTPQQLDMDNWLPRILGGSEGGSDVFPMAETLPWFAMLIDKQAATASNFFQYSDCKVNKATFSCSAGEPLQLALDILGKTETKDQAWPGSPPSLTDAAATAAPWIMSDLVLTLASTAVTCYSFSCSIDNALDVKFANSVNATSITESDRIVQLDVEVPYTATEHDLLYDQGATGDATATAVFTNASGNGEVLTFTFGLLQFNEQKTPTVSGKSEVTWPLSFMARKPDAATDELTITNAT